MIALRDQTDNIYQGLDSIGEPLCAQCHIRMVIIRGEPEFAQPFNASYISMPCLWTR